MGKGSTGGGLAAPIFKEFMSVALKDNPPTEFPVPAGMKLISVDRKTGMRSNPGAPGSIVEAFKPGTGPADSYWVIGMGDDLSAGSGELLSPAASQAITTGGGGLY
jgi:penicillin-binding protein 1A